MSAPAEAAEGGEAAGEGVVPRKKSKKLLLIGGGVLLLLGGGGVGAFFSGALDPLLGIEPPPSAEQLQAEAAPEAPVVHEPVFYELPEFIVSLLSNERRSPFLKLKVSLELTDPADEARIQKQLPRVTDDCQVYLRELRLDDIRGSAGTTRLREELHRRISAAVAPVEVRSVLFADLLIQ